MGGLGNDTYIVIPGSDSVLDESGDLIGIDTIDLSLANSGLVLDLAQDAGQVQLVDGANTIALTGTFENVRRHALQRHVLRQRREQ